jgi:hypothetical protein
LRIGLFVYECIFSNQNKISYTGNTSK